MITKDQIRELSLRFQIDAFTVFREYLQLVFLSYLYQEKEAGRIFFKGGTALRLLFGSPRFSEDLDFSTAYSDKEITGLLAKLEAKIVRELPGLKIIPVYSGTEGVRFGITFTSPGFKYPLTIRLDFHKTGNIKNTQASTLTTPFPVMIFPQVFHLTGDEILKEKLTALQTRRKGRDIFDVWFLLPKGTKLPKVGYNRDKVIQRIVDFPERELNRDLGKFLPKNQKIIIPHLKQETIKLLQASE
ncbi:MAG: nucleotidyl transferase AbiEii/AbiGii toxin family protein [Candidatus Gottesmanbacteria bacterium]|nr:nucleotidyl transferase AbiEii/AbiGii toxin family protein [Candidatus Gottesmanbacteria bacterium]